MDPLHLDRRRFVPVSSTGDGDVNPATAFVYHEEPGGLVWARYSGGDVELGHLTGRRDGDRLRFRYSHVDTAGETASGSCHTRIEILDDGRLRLHESWSWDSRDGSGTSVLEEDWSCADTRFEVVIELAGGVTLRPQQLGDAADVARLSTDPDLHRFTMITRELSADDARTRAWSSMLAQRDGTAVRFVIRESDGEMLGECGAVLLANRTAELHYWLVPAARGRGLATACLRAVTVWLVDNFEVGRLQLKTHPDNTASMAVAERVGFQREGLIQGDLYVAGAQEDTVWFSLLPGEFRR